MLTIYLYWINGILRGYAIRSGRRPSGSQRPGRMRSALRPLTSLGTSAWPYRVTTQYSYYHRMMVLLFLDRCVSSSNLVRNLWLEAVLLHRKLHHTNGIIRKIGDTGNQYFAVGLKTAAPWLLLTFNIKHLAITRLMKQLGQFNYPQ